MKHSRRVIFLAIIILFSVVTGCSGKNNEFSRPPAVAGLYYPAAPGELNSIIDKYLAQVPAQAINGEIIVLIVPHAGYVYSGPIAAYGYKLLANTTYDTVILIGPSHHEFLNVASIYTAGSWETPLGKVAIDSALAKAIVAENNLFACSDQAHQKEHSLEVQLPFLQKTLHFFRIVPILVSDPNPANCALLAQAIIKNCDPRKKYLIVASTDMSHYHTQEEAKTLDKLALALLEKQDLTGLTAGLNSGACELCGQGAVLTALAVARLKGPAKVKILKYATSGDVTGDLDRVVGYGATVIYTARKEADKGEKTMINQDQQQELLKIARKTIEAYVTSGAVPDFKITDPLLKEKRGVFVTLNKDNQLRGCIGYIMPIEPLYLAVSKMAIEAATGDPRFPPVTREELSRLEIEISVLTVPERVKDPADIILGTHGVIVRKGGCGGVFLPQVAIETGWSKEEFLNELCSQKAGLPEDAWKNKDTELYIFSAEVFSERR
ncbi:MAG: AmmeMemoRadiSam system protein B [bacterium]|nr:AmmeMemoRadiSam system protein B [bacterium]